MSIVPSARGFTTNLRREIGDLDGFGRGIGDNAGSGFASGFGSTFKGLALSLGAAFVGAIAVDKLFDVGGAAFKVAADFEVTQTSFEGLLGGVDPARALLDDLRDFAETTPFSFPELSDAARKLLAFGFDAEEIVPTMQQLGDAAAAVGASDSDINLVVRALGQIGSKGRVQLEELNQIAEAFPGVNPIEILAKGIGVSTPEFTNALSKPGGALAAFGLTGEQAVDILVDGFTDQVPGAMGAMERQSLTLNGTLERVKDTLSRIAIDTLTPFLPSISAGIRSMLPFIEGVAAQIPGLIQRAAAAASRGVDFFRDAFSGGTIGEGLSRVFDGVGAKIAELWPQVMPALDRFVQNVADFLLTQGPGILRALRDGFFQFVNWLATEFWPTVLPYLMQWLGQLAAWATGTAAPAIGEWVKTWAAAFVDWVLTTALPWLAERLGAFLAWLQSWITGTAIPWLIEKGPEWAVALVDWIATTAIPWMIEKSAEFLVALQRWVTDEAIPWLAGKAVDWALALVNWIVTDAIPTGLQKLGEFLTSVQNWITNTAIPGVVEKAAGLAGALLGWIADAIRDAPGKLGEFLGSVTSWLRNDAPGAISDAAAGMWDGIAGAFRSAINEIIGAWNGLSFSLPGVDLPGPIDFGGATISTPNIDYLAKGGVITSPTLAMLAEVPSARPEIVTPERLMRQVVLDAISEANEVGVAAGIPNVDLRGAHFYTDELPRDVVNKFQRGLARVERSSR